MQGPSADAPPGTVWFGGRVDRFRVTLRVSGERLDPDLVSGLLQCQPSELRLHRTAKRADGTVISRGSQWSLTASSTPDEDIEGGVNALLDRLPADLAVWRTLTASYKVDLFCGLFLEAENRGFGLTPATSKRLADRNLEIGFDLYARPMAASSR